MGKYLLSIGGLIFILGAAAFGYISYAQKDIITPIPYASPIRSSTDLLSTSAPQKIPARFELYIDFNCPYCRKFYKNSFAPLRKQYKTKIPFSIHHFPLQENGISMEVAKFYECATQQKNQWDVLDMLYFGYDEFDGTQMPQWIEQLEIEAKPIELCMAEEAIVQKIQEDKIRGQEKKVRGTPTILLNEKKFEGNTAAQILEMEILKAISR